MGNLKLRSHLREKDVNTERIDKLYREYLWYSSEPYFLHCIHASVNEA